jgi:hypothetical protein
MNRRAVYVVALIAALLVGQAVLADGLRSVGVRVVSPTGRAPFLIGIEASADVPVGVLTGAFFLSGAGKTVITASYDLPLAGDPGGTRTFVRLTTGLYYFDRQRFLPSLLFGGGLSLEVAPIPALALAVSGEFLYPWAFPVPLVSASGRWVLP